MRIRSLYKSCYYSLMSALPRQEIALPEPLQKKINLFLYFDYEREFSGHKTTIQDHDISTLVEILVKKEISATWFTVGEVFKKYTDSVLLLKSNGFELGSHTYNHLSPLMAGKKRIIQDFYQFEEIRSKYQNIHGFHAPNGKWSLRSSRLLYRLDYHYEVISQRKMKYFHPRKLWLGYSKYLMQFCTIGDDWNLYKTCQTDDDAYNHFYDLTETLQKGDLCGVGFHPWVLFSNDKIFNGFLRFLEFLKYNENIQILTAESYHNIFVGKVNSQAR